MSISWVGELIDSPLPSTPMIISGGILPQAGSMMLYGEAGAGKSMLTLHIASCLAKGEPFFKWHTKQSVVLLKQVELPLSMFRDRLRDFERVIGRENSGFDYANGNGMVAQSSDNKCKLDSPAGLQQARTEVQWLRDRQPGLPITMIFDPLYKMSGGHLSDQYDTTKLTDHLDILRFEDNVSIIVLHHNHKVRRTSDGKVIDEGQDAQSGSAFLQAWPDTILRMWGTKKKDRDAGLWTNYLSWEKYRYAKNIPYAFTIKWDIESIQPELYTPPKSHDMSKEDLSLRNMQLDDDDGDDSWMDISMDSSE